MDRHHSHFIIVKNVKNVETLKKTGKAPFGGEIELRNRVEQELRVKNSSKNKYSNLENPIPVITHTLLNVRWLLNRTYFSIQHLFRIIDWLGYIIIILST